MRGDTKDAGSKLLGHCGDAETQDVMNACFALEFDNANREMNSTLEIMLKQLDASEQSNSPVSELCKERGCSIVISTVKLSARFALAAGVWNQLK